MWQRRPERVPLENPQQVGLGAPVSGLSGTPSGLPAAYDALGVALERLADLHARGLIDATELAEQRAVVLERTRGAQIPVTRPMTRAPSGSLMGAVTFTLAGLGMMVGAFLPWATIVAGPAVLDRRGADGLDGPLALALGALLLVCAASLAARSSRTAGVFGFLVGAAGIALAVVERADIERILRDAGAEGHYGSGLVLVGLASAFACIVGGLQTVSK